MGAGPAGPLSPFGRAARPAPRWYGPGRKAALADELDNLALSWALGRQAAPRAGGAALLLRRAQGRPAQGAPLRGVTRCLPLFHDIRGSFDRDPATPFDLVELFEIKHFLVTLEQVQQAYAALPPCRDRVPSHGRGPRPGGPGRPPPSRLLRC